MPKFLHQIEKILALGSDQGHAEVGEWGVTPPHFAEAVGKSLGLSVITWLIGSGIWRYKLQWRGGSDKYA